MFRELVAGVRNMPLGKGWKPPHGEVWTADMLLPEGHPDRAQETVRDWKADQAALIAKARKMKAQAQAFSPEGRAAVKQNQNNLRTTAERRRVGEQMKKDGADPQSVRHYLLTGAQLNGT